MVVQHPACRRVHHAFELAVIPFRNLVSDEQRFVVTEGFRNAGRSHGNQHVHDKILKLVDHVLVFKNR